MGRIFQGISEPPVFDTGSETQTANAVDVTESSILSIPGFEPEAKADGVVEFSVVTVTNSGEIANVERKNAPYRTEDLGNGLGLEMISIAADTFTMGSSPDEENREDDEGPQHQVTVPAFEMGKYQVTQAQWRAIASLPKVNQDLEADPSRFKGDNRPVEQISWNDAVEFCDRLSQQTEREYRLPSEAEWEYACRAGTTTPFNFGETITPDLANYNGNYTYGSGPKGVYRQETTDVGSFSPNAFGLYDMHGNLYDWCLDHWHDNYEGAPADGSAWIEGGDSSRKLLRGGSWYVDPWYCRSADRGWYDADFRYYNVGFRVVCSSPRTS
ncbi:MAG: formylglycine-generating enzyme family protein [Elainellaceae cyanobacterium]